MTAFMALHGGRTESVSPAQFAAFDGLIRTMIAALAQKIRDESGATVH